jgi:hypothetical protein
MDRIHRINKEREREGERESERNVGPDDPRFLPVPLSIIFSSFSR